MQFLITSLHKQDIQEIISDQIKRKSNKNQIIFIFWNFSQINAFINFVYRFNLQNQMFQHHMHQRKSKNWKILNQNFQQIQDQNQFNRSALIQQPKRYCPRKDISKEKIFSKSKERLAPSSTQITNSNSLNFKKVSKDSNHKQTTNRNNEFPSNKDHKDQKVQTSNFQHKKNQMNKDLFLVSQQIQSYLSNTSRNGPISLISNCKSREIFYENTSQHNIIQHKSKVQQNQKNEKINSAISEIKEQFQSFKSLVISELNHQKEQIRKTIQQILEFIGKLKSQTRQIMDTQIQQKVFNQMKGNSNDIRVQQQLNHNPTQKHLIKLADSLSVKVLDLGAFQQQLASSNLCGKQNFLTQKFCAFKQSSLSKSADNLTGLIEQREQVKQHLFVPITQAKSTRDFNRIKQGIQGKNLFEPNEQNGRYSEFLKKEYEQKRKKYQSKKVSNQQKISSRIQHLQKFNGAMQKLKSDLQQIKQISDTKDIKKVKILEQKDQKLFQYPPTSQLNCSQQLTQILYQQV